MATEVEEVRHMSEQETGRPVPYSATLERSREDILNSARPLPWDEEMVFKDLTDEEEASFLAALLDA